MGRYSLVYTSSFIYKEVRTMSLLTLILNLNIDLKLVLILSLHLVVECTTSKGDESMMNGLLESFLSPSVFSHSRFIPFLKNRNCFIKINYNYIFIIYKYFDCMWSIHKKFSIKRNISSKKVITLYLMKIRCIQLILIIS